MTELLVVLAILGLLLTLTVPAVQASREAARATDCRNRMRQLGLAILNFESRMRQLPIEGGPLVNDRYHPRPVHADFSVQAQLLMDLDQAPLAARFDFTQFLRRPFDGEIPACPVLTCPSDSGREQGLSYRVCGGSQARRDFYDPQRRGAFTVIRTTTMQDVVDGTSSTVAMSERLRSDETPERYDPAVDAVASGAGPLFGGRIPTPDEMHDVCRALAGASALGYSGQVGWYWHRAQDLQTQYNHVAPPNSRVTDCTIGDLQSSLGPGYSSSTLDGLQLSARSRHSGGVHCLYLDGGVRFVGDTIDLDLWRAMATIAGGEIQEGTY
jgi:prepilin-type processing-associated H-X9-DG protein